MSDIDRLVQALAKLPGLGPRSARRAALYMLERRETVLAPLVRALADAARSVKTCATCGNLDSTDPCAICVDPRREGSIVCVVETVADVWALERSHAFRGRYHVLGGTLSALDDVGPDDLNIASLVNRARSPEIAEVVLATGLTVDGQTTAHYIVDRLEGCGVTISAIAHGVPLGGELDYMDDGTLGTALTARRPMARG